jgi:hypothetical protein
MGLNRQWGCFGLLGDGLVLPHLKYIVHRHYQLVGWGEFHTLVWMLVTYHHWTIWIIADKSDIALLLPTNTIVY